jgi:hypothetical protein
MICAEFVERGQSSDHSPSFSIDISGITPTVIQDDMTLWGQSV